MAADFTDPTGAVSALIRWAYELIHTDWMALGPEAEGCRWMAEAERLFPDIDGGNH